MDSKTRKIFVACALGAMAGMSTASILPFLVWWMGALVGGITSGALYAFGDILRYAPAAAKIAWKEQIYLPRALNTLTDAAKRIKRVPLYKKLQAVSMLIFFATMAFCIWANWVGILEERYLLLSFAYLLGSGLMMLWAFFCGSTAQIAFIIFLQTPPGMLLACIAFLCLMAAMMAIEGWPLLKAFIRNLFFFIYSRELVLCAVDGALGAGVSYILFVLIGNMELGPALLSGGLLGGLLGVVNYEIVSKRLLHLAPSN